MRNIIATAVALLTMLWIASCAQKKGSVASSKSISADRTFTDARDKKTYKTVKIGEQTWMAENVNYSVSGSKCYDNKPDNCEKYGRLYHWGTAMKACPSGWHLPSKEEWQALVDFAGGYKVAGKKLKAVSGWNDYEGKSSNGTDIYGFSALPGGTGHSSGGNFSGVGITGMWWNSSEYRWSGSEVSSGRAYYAHIYYNNEHVYWHDDYKDIGLSVRCLKD
ncbi:MAG: fibrobacter succinogenes major paralogous domain-containing protein [Fibromonadaceae bacterium]|nr:fibrobacter succinogenes major paralogous domain-containing protein [Fibromonadaceae bacterium]